MTLAGKRGVAARSQLEFVVADETVDELEESRDLKQQIGVLVAPLGRVDDVVRDVLAQVAVAGNARAKGSVAVLELMNQGLGVIKRHPSDFDRLQEFAPIQSAGERALGVDPTLHVGGVRRTR